MHKTKQYWNMMCLIYVTLEHKISLKYQGYICSSSQKYIVWVRFLFYAKNH